MSILCHLALFLYSLVGIGLSVVAGGLYFRVLPNERVWNEFLFLAGRWETILAIGIYLLFSLYLLLKSLSSNKRKENINKSEALVVTGRLGDVQVSLEALKDVTVKIANSIPGVRDVKVKIKLVASPSDSKITVPSFNLKLTIGESDNVVSISDTLRQNIMDYLNKCIGVSDGLIDITVVTITQTPVNGKKRVV